MALDDPRGSEGLTGDGEGGGVVLIRAQGRGGGGMVLGAGSLGASSIPFICSRRGRCCVQLDSSEQGVVAMGRE